VIILVGIGVVFIAPWGSIHATPFATAREAKAAVAFPRGVRGTDLNLNIMDPGVGGAAVDVDGVVGDDYEYDAIMVLGGGVLVRSRGFMFLSCAFRRQDGGVGPRNMCTPCT
jgi:hypothetical protein